MYLWLFQVKPAIEVNLPADTGNTALHAAANNGNHGIVELLCGAEGVDVNAINPACEKATPLHLAAMHGRLVSIRFLSKKNYFRLS